MQIKGKGRMRTFFVNGEQLPPYTSDPPEIVVEDCHGRARDLEISPTVTTSSIVPRED